MTQKPTSCTKKYSFIKLHENFHAKFLLRKKREVDHNETPPSFSISLFSVIEVG